MRLSDRIDALEALLMKHLEESGEIRADLKWLKKSYFYVFGAIVVEVGIQLFKR